MKGLLLSLLNEYKNKYPELISLAEYTHKTKKWGMGIMPSYNPAPYTCELQGCKPGRLLKKNTKPAKDRYCYLLDENDKFIAEIQYATHVKFKDQWVVYRRFFLNEPGRIIQLTFGSNFEGSTDANLDSTSITTLIKNHPTAHYSLLSTGEYFETIYEYDAGAISSVTENIWRETFTARHYEINSTNDNLTIFERFPGNSKLPIYPES